jgi:hypothetical protein
VFESCSFQTASATSETIIAIISHHWVIFYIQDSIIYFRIINGLIVSNFALLVILGDK